MARILFLQDYFDEFLGTGILSSLLKQHGHQVELFITSAERDLLPKVKQFQPDIVGMTSFTGAHQKGIALLKELKSQLDFLSILGGPHPTFFPEVIEQNGIDVICRGEGERSMVELAKRVEQSQDFSDIPNLWVKRNGQIIRNEVQPLLDDLDEAPDPDRTIYYKYRFLRNRPSKSFITGRGCPWECTFCFNKAFNELYQGKGKVFRRHSVARVLGSIETIASNYPMRHVWFVDDVFTVNKRWLTEFLEEYRKQFKFPFTCITRADTLKEDMVKMMAEANCHAVFIGLESASPEIQKAILKKKIDMSKIRQAADWFHKYGIRIGTYNMLGTPGESLEQALETLRFNQEVRTSFPWVSLSTPYPGTELAEIAKEKGLLESDFSLDNIPKSYLNKLIIKHEDAEKLRNLHKLFILGTRWPKLDRLIRYLIKLPPNPLFDYCFGLQLAYIQSEAFFGSFWYFIYRALKLRKNF